MTRAEIDQAGIAVMESGARIIIYEGEGADDDCFAGELIDPPEKMARMGLHVSCMWDCAKVVSLEPRHLDKGEG